MTIIVGIKCQDGLVLASDSQTTDENFVKQMDAQKISVVDFDGDAVLVAEAGLCSLSGAVLRIFQKKAGAQKIQADDSPAILLAQAAREVRMDQMALCPGEHSPEVWQRYFRDDNAAQLTIAYYFAGKPELYTVSLEQCTPIRISTHFAAVGHAKYLGDYLLKEYCPKGVGRSLASMIAVYVVEMVKQHDASCSGPVRLGWVGFHSPEKKAIVKSGEGISPPRDWRQFLDYSVGLLPQPNVDKLSQEVLAMHGQAQEQFKALTAQRFEAAAERHAKELDEAFDRLAAADPGVD